MAVTRLPRPRASLSPPFVALVMMAAPGRAAAAAGGLVIESDSSCPSTGAVREALLGLRPADDWPSTTVVVSTRPGALAVAVGPGLATPRQVAVGPDCGARATTVALIVATWIDALPAELVGPPHLSSPPAPPVVRLSEPPRPIRPAGQREIGVGLLAAMVGGTAPGIEVEFVGLGRASGLGWQASLALPAPRELAVGGGTTRWTRVAAGLALVGRFTARRFFVAGEAGPSAAYTRAWGQGYGTNRTDQSVIYGFLAGLRAGVPWGRLRIWSDVRATKWVYEESVQIENDGGGAVSRSLPTWDVQGAVGASYAF